MNVLPKEVYNLINLLERLPGLGPKSAARIALYILKSNEKYTKDLGELLLDLKKNITKCDICSNIASSSPCPVCLDEGRDRSTLCVVEDVLDVLAFENSIQYNGLYHVLGGVISPVSGVNPEDLTISALVERLKNGSFKEVILALNPVIEGEATAMYVQNELKNAQVDVKITRLARGLPSGADLEYADKVTIQRAFEGRG